MTAEARPRIDGPIPGTPVLRPGQFNLKSVGYLIEEYFISGTATAYRRLGAVDGNGRWDIEPTNASPYVTRLVVMRPSDPELFNGTAIVEWFNVSGGLDAAPGWLCMHREIVRSGYAYVGVSVQRVGVEGGTSLTPGNMPLKQADPARYGQLSHPGDAYAYDIYSQAGRVVRDGAEVLGPLKPERVLAIGESQSAFFLTTYVNAVDPVAEVYDGFLIHSRFGGASSIEGVPFFDGGISGMPAGTRLRDDLRAPVITVITETDLVGCGPNNVPGGAPISGFVHARQPDHDRLRIWEIAGTAHADTYAFNVSAIDSGVATPAQLAAAFMPTTSLLGMIVDKPFNSAPQHHYVVEGALAGLDRWVRTGVPPASADPIKVRNPGRPADAAELALDDNGIAEGGVRTPWVDVPTVRLSGVGNSGGPLGFLVGVTEPLEPGRLEALYPEGKTQYLQQFEGALRSSIDAGFILQADEAEIMGLAAEMYPQ
jgi:hypothetical protein